MRARAAELDRGATVADARAARGRADEDLVADDERRDGHAQVRLVHDVGFPDDLAALLVGGDDARGLVGDGDDVVAEKGGAAIGFLPLLFGIHAPEHAAEIAGAHVDLVERAR